MRSFALALVGLLLLLFVAKSAFGQGTEPHLPDPLSTIRLHRLLEGALAPDDPRWEEIELAHDRLLDAYRANVAERGRRLLSELGEAGQPLELRTLREARLLASSIAEEENRFFASLGTILGEEAAAAIALVRDRRIAERACNTLGRAAGVAAQPRLLGDIVRGSIDDPALLRELEPKLDANDRATLALLRRAADKGLAAVEAGLRAVREARLPAPEAHDPNSQRLWWMAYQSAGEAERAEQAALLAQRAALDLAVLRDVVAHLDLRTARAVRWRIERSGETLYGGQVWLEVLFQLALRSKDLDAEAKAAALDLYLTWAAEDEAHADACQEAWAIASGDPEAFRQFHEASARRREANSAWQERLTTEKPPWVETLHSRWSELVNGRPYEEIDPFDPEFLFHDGTDQPRFSDPRWRLRPIDEQRTERLGDRLALDEDDRAILRSLAADARSRWDERTATLNEAVMQTERAMWRTEQGRIRPIPDRIDDAVRARLDFLIAAAPLDDALYDDVRTALGAHLGPRELEEIELSRLSRALERLEAGHRATSDERTYLVRPVDPIMALDGIDLPSDARSGARSLLLERADLLLGAARTRAEIHAGYSPRLTAAYEAAAEMSEENNRRRRRGGMTSEEWAAMAERDAEAQHGIDRFKVTNIGARLEADRVIRAIFAEAIAGLDEELRRRAEEAYERRAVPDFFERTLRNTALAAERRAAIEALMPEYRERMTALAVRFGDHRRAPIDPDATMRKSDGIRAGFEQAILFDRDELSARTVARLRRALSAEERAQSAGLDDYERRNETPRR